MTENIYIQRVKRELESAELWVRDTHRAVQKAEHLRDHLMCLVNDLEQIERLHEVKNDTVSE